MKRLLAINCGSTSTKVAWFEDERMLHKASLDVPLADLATMPKVIDQLEYRTAQVTEFLVEHGLDLGDLDMVVCRGGTIWHVPQAGAYGVNELMLATERYAPPAQHASALSSMIGAELVAGTGVPVIIYDPTCVDSVDPVAKVTGIPDLVNLPVLHLLNTRKAGHTYAASIGRRYDELNLVIAHLGGGISLGFHDHGRVADWVYDDEGPMSPQRAGRIPTRFLTDLCYDGTRTHQQMRMFLAGGAGLAAWFGTQDVRDVEAMIAAGDEQAELVYRAMALGVAKAIGELSVVRAGQVDQILLTGGIAYSELFTGWVSELVSFIAPVTVVPGEQEMEALAEGGLRVLRGEEDLHTYDVLPPGYSSLEEVLTRPSFLA
ncbi:butyrate kinase [Actinotalea sp. M2MS4P-6]|uniref:butyrate kinase n=1 Tax=Actinotalea sp. M2MS4P-6 TaxID=2983762 RepID=UPI0021E49859|nr:butyrate kinase [Actinotalea sp. M2MS4P-6]MCV2394304.1 butyrate kinase [Actinotalea sp. M2MS4P-6]